MSDNKEVISPEDFNNVLRLAFMDLEITNPTDYLSVLDRERPYEGQPQTNCGERGKTEVKGLTYRDIYDCAIIGLFRASGIQEQRRASVYDIDLNEIDPIAFIQNMTCEMEKRQGIYPNVPELEFEP